MLQNHQVRKTMEKKEFHETKAFIFDDGKIVTAVSVSGSSTSSSLTVSPFFD